MQDLPNAQERSLTLVKIALRLDSYGLDINQISEVILLVGDYASQCINAIGQELDKDERET